jgi:hypothetical protein
MSFNFASSHYVGEDSAEERLRRALRSLPARIPPAGLTTSLRVIASRERKRFLEHRTWRQAMLTWYENLSVRAGEMIRTAALPVAGGLVSAVVLFSTWLVPTYPVLANSGSDVPTELSTEATVQQTAATGLTSGDAVDVTINDQGRVVDISFVGGPGAQPSSAHRHETVENLLLFTRFSPATEFGHPMPSKIRLYFSQVDVKD